MSLIQEYYHGKGPLILSPGCRLKEILLPLNSVYFQSDPEKGPLPKPTTGISDSEDFLCGFPYILPGVCINSISSFYAASLGSAAPGMLS